MQAGSSELAWQAAEGKEGVLMKGAKNRRIVLAARPVGEPVDENFRLEESDIPAPGEGETLLRTVYLSLDPYMRGRQSYAPPYP